MGKVGIVVVTYNRIDLLKEVIESLRFQTYSEFQIVVVNNGSTDGTFEWLSQQTDIVVITQKNLGGAGGFFTGMKYIAEHDFDYCWIMDDDVVCQSDALEQLMCATNVYPNFGFMCSRVIGCDGGAMNTPVACKYASVKNSYPDFYKFVADYGMVQMSSATFVSVLFNVEKIREMGLPIKEYFIWGDDSEYTTRLSTKYTSFLVCRSVVVHKRALQKPLRFLNEKNPYRINNYFYMIRNQIRTRIMRKDFLGLINRVALY